MDSSKANLVLEKIDKNLDWQTPPLVGTESQVFPKIYFDDSPYTINMLNVTTNLILPTTLGIKTLGHTP